MPVYALERPLVLYFIVTVLFYTLSHWLTFFSVVLLFNLCPGPDMALILGHTIRGGRLSGFAALCGTWAGTLTQVIMVVLGISTLLAKSTWAFAIFKWLGAAYLCIIGMQMLIVDNESFEIEEQDLSAYKSEFWAVFRQGFLSDILNPKAIIFMLTFLPQFAVSDTLSIWFQELLHGVLLIFISGLVMGPVITFSARFYESVLHVERLQMTLYRVFGVFLIAIGISFQVFEI